MYARPRRAATWYNPCARVPTTALSPATINLLSFRTRRRCTRAHARIGLGSLGGVLVYAGNWCAGGVGFFFIQASVG